MICPHCRREIPFKGGTPLLSPVELVLRQRDLERVEARISLIRGSYSDHQTWDQGDREEIKVLKARQKELKAILGFIV